MSESLQPEPFAHFQRLHALFDLVIELPPEEREAEIERSTADSPALAAELRALLEQAARVDTPLDSAAVRGFEPAPPAIPGYRLHRCIGRGGSATVYLADQEHAEFTRVVALKVVDRMFDAVSLRSVREEQRILARLEHPGIARLYDAGVTLSGQPWLAMEHVEGESILEHCRVRNASVRERIELFLSALDAVAHAHARGVIHRDLKPANIFVGANGAARLLDFGIARLSDPGDRDETRTLQRALTPAYASPEQLRGDRTTLASDIYSLGVVLYELLTGVLPNAHDPLPASVAGNNRELRGDVDAILAKALRQQPEERYASAHAMADDLRRLLEGVPAAVRLEHHGYRARRFLIRHRLAAVAIAAVVLFAVSWQIAERFRDAKRSSAELAIFHDAKGASFETRRLLRDGANRLERFDAMGARDAFRRAAQASRGNVLGVTLAWDGVSRAESALGEIGLAAEAARRAHELIGSRQDLVPPQEIERIHARAFAANRDWNRAIGAFEAAFSAQPERIDIGLDLVATLLACGRSDDADTALGRVRQLANARGGDPRVDLVEAETAAQLSEYQRAAAAASRARDAATRLNAIALGQRAARIHADAIGRLDRREEARKELAAIVARNQALGLKREAAFAGVAHGGVLLRIATSEETRRVVEPARDGCANAGDRRCELQARVLLAALLGKEGKLAEALRVANATVADARTIGDRWAEGYALSQRIVLYNWADDVAAIEASMDETLQALRDSGNRQTLMMALSNLAIMSIESLDLETAEAAIVEAEGLARRVGSQLASAGIDRARGYLEQTRGDHELARKSYTAALEKARRAGVPQAIANYLSDLAWLELSDEQAEAAEQRAKEAIVAFEKAGDVRTAATTAGILAWTDAKQGNVASARQRLAVLREAAKDEGTDTAQFTVMSMEARVAGTMGDWPRAIALRRELVRMAVEWKTPGLKISQQVHLAEALHRAGERRALERLVAEMLPEIERHGLRGNARELRTLLASPSPKR